LKLRDFFTRLKLNKKDLTKRETAQLSKLNAHKGSDPRNLQEFVKAYVAYLDENLDMMVDPHNNDSDEDNGSVKTLSQDSKEARFRQTSVLKVKKL
jgi:hypothetical protein